MKAIETMIRKYYRLNHFPTELFMTEFIDFADEDEPATASDAYLAKLADYRRRLMMLRDELSRLNGVMERAEFVCEQAPGTLH